MVTHGGKEAPFTEEDTRAYLELARRCLADGDLADEMADALGLSDDEMTRLREQLQDYLGEPAPPGPAA